MAVAVLDKVEMLDQQIATARPVAQKVADLLHCCEIELTAFGRTPWALATYWLCVAWRYVQVHYFIPAALADGGFYLLVDGPLLPTSV